jgi:hypothetical protein
MKDNKQTEHQFAKPEKIRRNVIHAIVEQLPQLRVSFVADVLVSREKIEEVDKGR